MSKCKDCIHYEVCEAVRGRPKRIGRNALRVAEKHCPYHSFKAKSSFASPSGEGREEEQSVCGMFEDKESFLKLPCKVEDTVYRITTVDNSATHSWIDSVKIIDIAPVYKDILGYVHNISTSQFGKTVFLTKKEAEKALEEREKEWK